ncbi:MAG: hypothetical protein F6J96_23540 [Symploca sp. SIO1C2]|nr:hypothetical protein [Symploca sp. SIO1C2]
MDDFKESVAEKLGIPQSELYGHGLSLSDVIVNSKTAMNSIDIMEAFAYALARHGWEDRLNMPIFTLDSTIDQVIEEIENQLKTGVK